MSELSRTLGHIVSVRGTRLKVELSSETRSPVRASFDGAQLAVAINTYLVFDTGPGDYVIGMITDLEAREVFDPIRDEDFTLELVKPRRIADVQLLGSIKSDGGDFAFTQGFVTLPALDTPAEIASPKILDAIFATPPYHNRPSDFCGGDFDFGLAIGNSATYKPISVLASYNDLFSRPVAIVGNTGSGKSYTVTSIMQKAISTLNADNRDSHIFILDVNGEYGKAFCGEDSTTERQPDRIYINGVESGIPVWLFDAEEISAWLSAAEQTQEPVLKDWWSIAKSVPAQGHTGPNALRGALEALGVLLSELHEMKKKSAPSYCKAVCNYLSSTDIDYSNLEALFSEHERVDQYNTEIVDNPQDITQAAHDLIDRILVELGGTEESQNLMTRTADSPLFIPKSVLNNPAMISNAVADEDRPRIDSYLTTLKLRLNARLDDRRWRSFLNYEEDDTQIDCLETWLGVLGIGRDDSPRVTLIDLSMLSTEVLPFACAIIGRVLLTVREGLAADQRHQHPWVIVLEEAHNYAHPRRLDEGAGYKLARMAYERIAKEGRKFGISLIIASQRPSEISPTIISQCANFISHRLQDPDDIDHFRRIVPVQARRLLEQVTSLAAGEAIAFGSAFQIPTRVLIDMPAPTPHSQTAAPYIEWNCASDRFPTNTVVEAQGWANSQPEISTVNGPDVEPSDDRPE